MIERKKLNVIYALIGAIGLILVLLFGWYFFSDYYMKRFVDRDRGFAISYPATWTVKRNVSGAAVIFYAPLENKLDFFKENVNVTVKQLPKKYKFLEEYTDHAMTQMRVMFGKNFVPLEARPQYVANKKVFLLDFIGQSPEGNIHFRTFWLIYNKLVYQVTYTSMESQYDDYIEKVDKIFDSFQLFLPDSS